MSKVPRFSDREGTPSRISMGKSAAPRKLRPVNDEGGKVVGRNLAGMKTAEGLIPTPAEPMRLHYKMAGGC